MSIVHWIYALSIFIAALRCHVLSVSHRPRYVTVWESSDCASHNEQAPNVSCEIERLPKPQRISLSIFLTQPQTVVWVKFALWVPRPPNKSYMKLIEGDFDACQFLADGKQQNKLILYVYESIKKDSNMPKKCPFEVGWLYFRNISALDYFPAFLPETEFKLIVKVYKPDQESHFDMTLKGSIVEQVRTRKIIF